MNEQQDASKPLKAVDAFGGADVLATRLALMTRVTREARGLSPEDLAGRAQEGDAAVVRDFEQRRILPTKNILMAYLDALSLPLQNVMQIEPLDAELRRRWNEEMRRRKVALMARANGSDPAAAVTPEHARWALELFLRIEALNELCPPAQVVPDIKMRAERLHAALKGA